MVEFRDKRISPMINAYYWPYLSHLVPLQARVRVFCMTDDKEEKTLEHQEHFHEIAKSRDVEVSSPW